MAAFIHLNDINPRVGTAGLWINPDAIQCPSPLTTRRAFTENHIPPILIASYRISRFGDHVQTGGR
jgi:hypothetical protein